MFRKLRTRLVIAWQILRGVRPAETYYDVRDDLIAQNLARAAAEKVLVALVWDNEALEKLATLRDVVHPRVRRAAYEAIRDYVSHGRLVTAMQALQRSEGGGGSESSSCPVSTTSATPIIPFTLTPTAVKFLTAQVAEWGSAGDGFLFSVYYIGAHVSRQYCSDIGPAREGDVTLNFPEGPLKVFVDRESFMRLWGYVLDVEMYENGLGVRVRGPKDLPMPSE